MYRNTNTVRVQCNWLTVTCWHRLARVPCWGCVSQTANPRPQWWPGLVLLWSECKYNVHANTNTVTQTQIQIMRSCLFNLNPSTLLYYISLSSGLWNIDDWHKYPMSNNRNHQINYLRCGTFLETDKWGKKEEILGERIRFAWIKEWGNFRIGLLSLRMLVLYSSEAPGGHLQSNHANQLLSLAKHSNNYNLF